MKKIITTAWFLAATILLISACKDSPTGNETDPPDNQAPVLQADISYSPASPEVGSQVTLDASGSTDDQNIGYDVEWSLESKPSGSTSTIADPTQASTSFEVDVEGDYEVQLVISNSGEGVSDTATAIIQGVVAGTKEISGTIDTDSTLIDIFDDPETPDYRMVGDLDLNATLTVEPGVVVHVQEGYRMSVNSTGALVAEGAEADSIEFTSANEAGGLLWKGIYVGSSSQQNSLKYVKISHAAHSEMNFSGSDFKAAVGINEGGTLKIEHSRISDNNGYGVYVDDDGGNLALFSDNEVTGNVTGVSVLANSVSSIAANNQFPGNQSAAVEIPGSSLSQGSDVTWNALSDGASYFVSGNLAINGILTIAPGANFEMAEDVLWTVDGVIMAEGTSSDLIDFTSADASGGLYWKGLFVKSSDNRNALDHTRFSYAGNSQMDFAGANYSATVAVGASGKLSVTNSSISQSKGYGLYVDDEGGELTDFTSNSFSENSRAVGLPADEVDDMDTNTSFSNNSEAEVEIFRTTYSGTKTSTWQPLEENAAYRVTGRLVVNGELTIAAGARFEFDQDVPMEVYGALIAEGAVGNRIYFTTSNAAGGLYWRGIYVASSSALNKLNHVKISYAGESGMDFSGANYQAAVGVESGAKLSVFNTWFANSKGYGLYVDDEGGVIEAFADNAFENNIVGVGLPANEADDMDTATVFKSNDEAQVQVFGTTLDQGKTVAWNELKGNASYRVSGNLNVNGVLTIDPGTVLEMDENVQITVNGALIAEGNSTNQITFTSSNTAGGILWRGIFVLSSDTRNTLDYVTVDYPGHSDHDFSGTNYKAGIAVNTDARMDITNSTVSNSGGYGIYSKGITNDFTSAAANNTFSNNALGNVIN